MPKPTHQTLPDAALDHIPDHVIDKLPDHIRPPTFNGNIVFDDPTQSNVVLGTEGVADVFVFDVAAMLAGTEFQSSIDVIAGFETGLDTIAFINAPANYQVDTNFGAIALPFPVPGGDDSDIPNYLVDVYGDDYDFIVIATDVPTQPYVSITGTNTVLMPDDQILVI